MGGKDLKSGGVKFDGFKDGVLLEAKGPGYANKFTTTSSPNGGSRTQEPSNSSIRRNASSRRPRASHPVACGGEEGRGRHPKALEGAEVEGIEVVHTPALQ